jgi:hypothetical protein
MQFAPSWVDFGGVPSEEWGPRAFRLWWSAKLARFALSM